MEYAKLGKEIELRKLTHQKSNIKSFLTGQTKSRVHVTDQESRDGPITVPSRNEILVSESSQSSSIEQQPYNLHKQVPK